MKAKIYLLTIIFFVSFSVFATKNIEPDEDALLLASCQAITMTPKQENTAACIYFIRGFLATAQTIDPTTNKKQSKKNRNFYGYMSRPHRNWEQAPATRFFPFCVPEDEPKDSVITIVSKQLSPRIDTTKKLKDVIFKALKTEYPCSKAKLSSQN